MVDINWEFIIGVALGILGFAIGVYHVAELRKATKLAQEHTGHIGDVTIQLTDMQKELSTRYIGEFPDFISEIVTMIEGAKRKIVIFCDFPGYGFFSDPKNSLRYVQAIDLKRADVELSLTCLASAARLKLQREQFSDAEWRDWRQDALLAEKVNRFIATHAVDVDAAAMSFDDFVNLQERIDADLIRQLFGHSRTVEVEAYFPLHFWIVDDTSAIFSIPTLSDSVIEYGFRTADRSLIEAFLRIPERFQKAGGAPQPHIPVKDATRSASATKRVTDAANLTEESGQPV